MLTVSVVPNQPTSTVLNVRRGQTYVFTAVRQNQQRTRLREIFQPFSGNAIETHEHNGELNKMVKASLSFYLSKVGVNV